MKKGVTLFLAGLAALGACDGPREDAGEATDNAAGLVDGEDSIRSGPHETLGEKQDDALDASDDAREAQADALEDAAEAQREAADQLEEQAEQARGR